MTRRIIVIAVIGLLMVLSQAQNIIREDLYDLRDKMYAAIFVFEPPIPHGTYIEPNAKLTPDDEIGEKVAHMLIRDGGLVHMAPIYELELDTEQEKVKKLLNNIIKEIGTIQEEYKSKHVKNFGLLDEIIQEIQKILNK